MVNCNKKYKKPETEKEVYTRSNMWTSPQQILNFSKLKVEELQIIKDIFKIKFSNAIEAPISIKMRKK